MGRRRSKRRDFTEAERAELYRLCYESRMGRLGEHGVVRATELYAISPHEYAEIHAKARAAADATVNPLAKG